MKNLLCILFSTVFLTASFSHATAKPFGPLKYLHALSEPTLEWIEKIQKINPESNGFGQEIAALQKSDDPESMARLGFLYLNGLGVKETNQNKGKAYNAYIKPAAEQGNPFAEYLLGQIYLDDFRFVNGMGDLGMVAKNNDKAVSLLRKSAQSGFVLAQNQLGHIYYSDDVVQQDMSKGLEWFKKAASQGYAESIFFLGQIYYEGIGVPQDITEAKKWYNKAALEGYAPAQVSLGSIYYSEKKNEEALEWVQKAADQGYAEGQYVLGNFYLNGKLVKRSKEKSIEWLTMAAEQGHLDACYILYEAYRSADDDREDSKVISMFATVDEEDQENAMKWLKIAADNRHPNALATIGDNYIHPSNKGTDKIAMGLRYLEALKYDMGDRPLPPNLLQKLAEGYEWSENYTEAIKSHTALAELDYVPERYEHLRVQACIILGSYNLQGKGIEKSLTEANRWFQKAMILDHTRIDDILEVEQDYYSIDDPAWWHFATGDSGIKYYFLPKTDKKYKLLYNDLLKVLIKKVHPARDGNAETVSVTGWTMANNLMEMNMTRNPDKVQYSEAIPVQRYVKEGSGYKFLSEETYNVTSYLEIKEGDPADILKKLIWD